MKDSRGHIVSIFRIPVKKFPVLERLRNSRGFNLIELMIVVTIIGILAAVAIPLYQGYVQKSRIISLVYPGLHIIESNVALYYAMSSTLPGPSLLPTMLAEADTTYFNVNLPGADLRIIIDSPSTTSKLYKLNGMDLLLTPIATNHKIAGWELTGELANKLGITTE